MCIMVYLNKIEYSEGNSTELSMEVYRHVHGARNL